MKRLSLLAAIIITVASCVSSQTKEASADNGTAEHLCGAYTEFRDVTSEELSLFDSALESFLAAKEVCTQEGCHIPEPWSALDGTVPTAVRTQVVAGLNYQFKCPVAVVTIYQPLPGQGEPSVTDVTFLRQFK